MIKVKKYDDLGKVNHGWLNANFHFSFGDYFDRENMNFGQLRVVNDDLVNPNMGFGMHPHENMEIITYIRKGAISHEDNQGNKGVTNAGDVQVMSAGSGIYHAEFNRTKEIANLYQIWIIPNKKDVTPRWDQAEFPKNYINNALNLLVSGREEDEGKGALYINQDAAIFGGRIEKDTSLTHMIKHQAYLLVSEGQVIVDGKTIEKGDAAAITEQQSTQIEALVNSEILLIDVPARN